MAWSRSRRAAAAAVAAGGALAGWGLFEAQWLEAHEVDVPVVGLPEALDGLTILHLSDFHAGSPSLNVRTMRMAVSYGVARQPDMVVVTGDIITHRWGHRAVLEQLARLQPPLGMYGSLGNHDTGDTRDPFSRAVIPDDWGGAPMQLLRDRSVAVEHRGESIEVAGMEPEPWSRGDARPAALFTTDASLRILLAHFPDVVDDLPEGACSLVLAGHLHGGQICLPRPGGRIRLSHTHWRYLDGVHRVGSTTLVVSRGTGTTLVPFRLLARPEVALLRLHAA
ncbi:MAG TPA: metallophosphoesterase [Gaiellales bacterium]|nr:metallophosphoesterase [Gaiellales bacterium]